MFMNIDWHSIFVPSEPILETIIRGTWFYNPPALLLVKNGRLLPKNMRQELITEDELLAQLHHARLEDIRQVPKAYMEGDGTITFIRRRE